MSRIADALLKTSGTVPASPSVGDEDHPWGTDLATELLAHVEPFEPAVPHHPPLTLTGVVPGSSGRAARPAAAAPTAPVADGPEGRLEGHLAALVERVFLPVAGEPMRSVAFVGVDARSSAVTAAAAERLARHAGATVCIVDAHFSAPSLHGRFGVSNDTGLSDAIADGLLLWDVTQQVRPNVWLLSAGSEGGRPSFASGAVRLRVAQFIARFDYVLIDMEPLAPAGDAAGLAPLVDGVILVVAAEATRRDAARRATQTLQGAGAVVLGAVLTNRQFPIPDAVYRRL
jgi:protein-tyrosine kinase